MEENKTYRRYFRVESGALIEELQKIFAKRQALAPIYLEAGASFGGEIKIYESGQFAGVELEQKTNKRLWRRLNNGLWVPRKTSFEGKQLNDRINKLPKYPGFQEALKAIDLHPNFPVLIDGRNGLCCNLGFINFGGPRQMVYVTLPWRAIAQEKIDDYLAMKEAGTGFCSEMDHLLWTPKEGMVEIKEWEMRRDLEATQEAIDAEKAAAEAPVQAVIESVPGTKPTASQDSVHEPSEQTVFEPMP